MPKKKSVNTDKRWRGLTPDTVLLNLGNDKTKDGILYQLELVKLSNFPCRRNLTNVSITSQFGCHWLKASLSKFLSRFNNLLATKKQCSVTIGRFPIATQT